MQTIMINFQTCKFINIQQDYGMKFNNIIFNNLAQMGVRRRFCRTDAVDVDAWDDFDVPSLLVISQQLMVTIITIKITCMHIITRTNDIYY